MWKYVRRDAKGWFVENPQAKLETIMAPTTGVRIDLDLARTFFFQLEKGALKEYAPDDARFEIRAVRAESRGMAMSHSRAE
jgi:hypothetical protein